MAHVVGFADDGAHVGKRKGVHGFDNSRNVVLFDIFSFSCPMVMTAKLSGKRFLNSTSNPDF